MNKLNEMQEKIVNHTEGAVMVLAGAGSGKTKVLTNRIAHILQNKKAYSSEILAITFTNKASNEMRERLSLMGLDVGNIWAQTFHSFCCRLLRYEAHNLDGYNSNFSIYDESDKKMVIKKILKEKGLKDDEYLSLVCNMLSDMKNQNLTLVEYEKYNMGYSNIKTLINVMEEYEKVLKNSNAFDFDDLLIKTLKLLTLNENVKNKYASKFKYILIDEFQDTNTVQYELVKILASINKNVFAVGDEDQSIYSWRGANIKNIQNFLKDFENCTLYKLEQNYRSTKTILNYANKIIKYNVNRIDKTLWTDNSDGVKVEYFKRFTETDEAESVAREIYNLKHYSGYDYKDIAILLRLNALSRSFEEKMLSYNIPYKLFGGQKFYERAEIKNILAYLKLLVNPQDNESFLRIVNFPKRGIGDGAINDLKQASFGYNMLNHIYLLEENCDKKLSKFLGFKNLMLDLKNKLNELNLTEFVEYLVEKLDLKNVYDTDKEEDQNRILNINEFVLSVHQFEENNLNATIQDYLQSVSLTTDLDTYNEDDNNVTLATVHSAKGLEFKIVFIVGVEEGYFPIVRRDTTSDSIEEERRLMYVAITRAKERLYLTSASSRFMYGKRNESLPSRFLKELELIKPRVETSYNENLYQKQEISSLNNISNFAKSTLKANSLTLFVGDTVNHSKFGEGKVVQVDNSTDMVVIEFAGIGRKILSIKFAPIQKIS